VATVVVALTAGLGVAYATRTVTITSHISISGKILTFHGRVTASNAACDAGRKVRLYTTTGTKLGTTTTGTHGGWKIRASGFAGISLHHFYAKVARRAEGTAGTIYVCTAAKSRTIPFHQ
jgi:hypothetical protein